MLRKSTEMYISTIEERKGKASLEDRGKEIGAWRRAGVLFMLDINYRWSSIVLEEREKSELTIGEMKAYAYGGYEKGLCAGDRAPDATGLLVHSHSSVEITKKVHERGSSLFKLIDAAKHSILIFPSPSSPAALRNILDGPLHEIAMFPKAKETIQTFFVSKSFPSGETSDILKSKSRVEAILVDQDGHMYSAYSVGDEEFTVVIIRPDGYIGAITMERGGVERYFRKILF